MVTCKPSLPPFFLPSFLSSLLPSFPRSFYTLRIASTGRAPGSATTIPGAYAVVGAAAITSGATHTLSTAVIVFELTGQIQHLVPVLLATLIAYSVAGLFTVSIYDMLLALTGLPYLPRVHSSRVYSLAAGDIMHANVKYLTLSSTYRDIKVSERHSTSPHDNNQT